MSGSRAPAFAEALAALLESRNAALIDIPVIQPADPFLDMAGEDLRRRIFLTENENGDSLCLRPEFTIPVCRNHIALNAATPKRYAYLGEVFRQRREGGNEFYQAGIEDLGEKDIARADARSVADALASVQAVAPSARLDVLLGDKRVGAITSAAQHYEMGPIALAVVKRSADPQAQLTVVDDGESYDAAQEVIVTTDAGQVVGRQTGFLRAPR